VIKEDIKEELKLCQDMKYFMSKYFLRRPLRGDEEQMIDHYEECWKHFLLKNKVNNVKQRPIPTTKIILPKSKKDETDKRRSLKRFNKRGGQK
jgi:hypothetical protein